MRRQARTGYALMEVVAVMGTAAVLLTTIGMTLHMMVRVSNKIQRTAAGQATWDRLTVRLQADAHRAREVEVTDDALTLLGEGWSVVYTSRGCDIVRAMSQGNLPRQRESYRLPTDSAASWELLKSPHLLVRCTWENRRNVSGQTPSLAPAEFLAAIGLEAEQ